MVTYEYECKGHVVEVQRSIKDAFMETTWCPLHKREAQWKPVVSGIKFTPTIGRDSGIYCMDYGRRATEDLTPKGKYARLVKAGTIGDPFAS